MFSKHIRMRAICVHSADRTTVGQGNDPVNDRRECNARNNRIEVAVNWMEQERRVFERRQQRDRAYSKWVRIVPWQLFGTFTFPGIVFNDESAFKDFAEFINRLEGSLKSDVAFIRGDERRLSGCGKPACGLHYRALLASIAPMHPGFVEWLWTSQVGQCSHDAGAFVVPYDPIRGGAEYDLYKPSARFRRNLRRLEM